MQSQEKKPTRNSIATMGTLSGLVTILRKLGSVIPKARKATPRIRIARANRGDQTQYISFQRNAAKKRMKIRVNSTGGLQSQSTADLKICIARPPGSAGTLSERTRDAPVLADAPEVHRHQHRRHQRDSHAMEDVETQQGRGAHESSG